MRRLTESEAVLLAVYFEEVSRAEAKMARDMGSHDAPTPGGGWQTDFELNADDEEEDET